MLSGQESIASLILLGGFLGLLLIRVPISFALAISALTSAFYLKAPVLVIAQKMSDGMDTFTLMAIPFFVLAGEIMARGGMARRLIDFARILVGWLPGGLAVVNVVSCMLFGGISGSSVADASAIGSILIPAMKERGYPRGYATGLTITASIQGLIAPTSHNAIIYALATGGAVSVAHIYVAGLIPLGMTCLILRGVALIIAKLRRYPKEPVRSLKDALRISYQAVLALVSPGIIVGGIVFGFFTPTEASAVAVLWGFICTFFIYREVGFRAYPEIVLKSVRVTAMVLFLIASASAFGYMLAIVELPKTIASALLNITANKYLMLLLLNVILLFLGMIMDMAPLILITTPIFLPLVKGLGISPVHFGVIMLINLGIGLLTPPVGSTLYVGCSLSGAKIEELVKSILPFYGVMFLILMLVSYLPFLTLWLVKVFFG